MFHLDISGIETNLLHPENMKLIFMALSVFHNESFCGKYDKEEQFLNIPAI